MEQVHLEGTLSSNSHKGVSGRGVWLRHFMLPESTETLRRVVFVCIHEPQVMSRRGALQ